MECFLLTQERGDVEHAGTLTNAHQGQAPCVHDVAHLIFLVGDPLLDDRLLALHGEVVDATQHLHQFRHLLCAVCLPAFLRRLLVVLGGRDEEEAAEGPQLAHEAHAVFHHVNNLFHAVERLVDTIVGHDGGEQESDLLVVLTQDILVVEPRCLLEVELSAALRALADVEGLNQLLE